MEKIKELLADGFQVADLSGIIAAILELVFGFIKDDQGWNDEAAEA